MIRYGHDPDGWVVNAEVAIGIERRIFRFDLGALPVEPDPGGLHSTPVVVVEADLVSLARAGALRAGGVPAVLILPGDAPRIATQFLVAAAKGVEVILVQDGGPEALTVARALGGRPILAPRPSDRRAMAATLAALDVDVHVAVPAVEGSVREEVEAALAEFDPDAIHHRVDVDPRPAFDELGHHVPDAAPDELTAAAAGVLAGRLAWANRRWRRGQDLIAHM